MRVLFCIRKNYLTNIAGDSIQLLKTAEYLSKKGLIIDINNGGIKDYSKYDVVHLFNLTRISETYEYYKIAKKYKKTIVISPIYWSLENYYNHTKSLEQIRLWGKYKPFRSEILNGCSMIYPASIMEMNLLKREYADNIPYTVVYNGVDLNDLYSAELHIGSSYILCVGRICPRKNQLALARVTNKLGVNLVLAGEANNKDYLNQCLNFKNVSYKGFLDICKLVPLYKNATLHALCSFVETPGLSSLEAGACGCNIISTSEGSTLEYFEDMTLYCNPYDETDIYNTVRRGLLNNKQPMLKNHIIQKFNIENCLNSLYHSYLTL